MIKDIIRNNETLKGNERVIDILHRDFPQCFTHDGKFDMEIFNQIVGENIPTTHEGYSLQFLGKNYASLVASTETTTVIVPDEVHNNLPANKNSKNIYISGDNLDALKHLRNSYSRKIKCIYIDPPYNTGSDGFVYNDDFNYTSEELQRKLGISESGANRILDMTTKGSASHSAWLAFMFPRLLLARDLMTTDGVIFISIDDNEQANLKLLCDSIFGEENFLALLSRRTKSGGGSAADAFAVEHDYICVYARDAEIGGKLFIPFDNEYLKRYSEEDEIGKFFWDTMERSSTKTRPYTIIAPDGSKLTGKWFRSEERFLREKESGEVRFLKKADGNWSVQFKQRLAEGKKMRTLLYENEFKSYSTDIDELGLEGTFSYPKTVFLIQYLLKVLDEGGIVLDFFSGSATTAHAIFAENNERLLQNKEPLSFIAIQLPEDLDVTLQKTSGDSREVAKNAITKLEECNLPHTLDYIGFERIKRAAKKIKEENPLFVGDLGFKHYTLKEPEDAVYSKLEEFNPEFDFGDNILKEFGRDAVLCTWALRDGYGLDAEIKPINLNGYEAYLCGRHLYLVNSDLLRQDNPAHIIALVELYNNDKEFKPENIVLFGYSFHFTEIEALKKNLLTLRDGIKNLKVNIDIRY